MRPLKNGRAPRVRHYLLSLALAPDVNMHGYLLCDDKRYTIEAAERMVAEADKVSTYPLRHMILATRLTADAELVRCR